MKLVEFKTLTPEGEWSTVMINPDLVCFLIAATIPSEVKGADGQAIGKPGAILGVGGRPMIVNVTISEAIGKLTA